MKNINDVLSLSVPEAPEYFVEKPVLATLRSLEDVGLGYPLPDSGRTVCAFASPR